MLAASRYTHNARSIHRRSSTTAKWANKAEFYRRWPSNYPAGINWTRVLIFQARVLLICCWFRKQEQQKIMTDCRWSLNNDDENSCNFIDVAIKGWKYAGFVGLILFQYSCIFYKSLKCSHLLCLALKWRSFNRWHEDFSLKIGVL